MSRTIPCSILRGGTSKGIYLLEKDIPSAGKSRDELLLRMMGSPDVKQIDGLGGAQSVTSKLAIVCLSERKDADVDYTFAQVSIDKPIVSYAGNCGNISSGVGPFAIESGLVAAGAQTTTVRIYNTNTEKIIIENVQTPNGQVTYDGDYSIAGVPGTAAPVKVMVMEPAGTVFDSLLPTGNTIDALDVPEFGRLEVSIVDASNPLVFVRANDIGFNGTELPVDIDSDPERLLLLENIRGAAAKLLGLVDRIEDAAYQTPGVPKMTIVSPPISYDKLDGGSVCDEQIDLSSRMMSMQKAHPTYAMTGAMCTAAAAVIPGTIVYELKREHTLSHRLRIGHPSGILEAGVDYEEEGGEINIKCAYGYRTARLLLKGTAYC